jgi:hypothetical protein
MVAAYVLVGDPLVMSGGLEARRVVGASWDGTAWVWDAASPYRRWDSPQIALWILRLCGKIE